MIHLAHAGGLELFPGIQRIGVNPVDHFCVETLEVRVRTPDQSLAQKVAETLNKQASKEPYETLPAGSFTVLFGKNRQPTIVGLEERASGCRAQQELLFTGLFYVDEEPRLSTSGELLVKIPVRNDDGWKLALAVILEPGQEVSCNERTVRWVGGELLLS